jgi:hypothetical protein
MAVVAQAVNFSSICAIVMATDRAGRVVFRSLDLPSVVQRQRHLGGRFFEQIRVFLIDHHGHLACKGAHRLVVQRLLGECGNQRRAVDQRICGEIRTAELGTLGRLRIGRRIPARCEFGDRDLDARDLGQGHHGAQFEGRIDCRMA